MSRLDFVIYGATGFTGRYVVQDVVLRNKNQAENISWGVAGRNESKLKQLLKELEKKNNCDFSNIPVIIADAKDQQALNAMACRAKVVLNCAGPYRFTGELVVKACVENGAHHVDISGEPQFLESMQLKYNETAEKNGVYVVGACGFDSIPTDMGVVYLEQKFEGQVNAVETYLDVHYEGTNLNSALIHYTTLESAVHGFAHAAELKGIRKQLYPQRLPALTPRLESRGILHWNQSLKKWCIPFPGSDRSVVQRSQRFLLDNEKKRPVQISTYVAVGSFFRAVQILILSAIFGGLALFKFGRKLLLEYPKLFTVGAVSHEGPSEETAENTIFSVTIFGSGWSEKSAEPLDIHTNTPNKNLTVKVSGTNPGYGATAAALVVTALIILRESDKMPKKGGVLPPGSAFSKTSIIEKLSGSGYKFEILRSVSSLDWNQGGGALSFLNLGTAIEDLINRGIY